MLINYTEEEQQALQKIREELTPKAAEVLEKLKNCTDKAEKTALQTEYQLILDKIDARTLDLESRYQKEHFARIKGGTPGLLKEAKKQAPAILKFYHDHLHLLPEAPGTPSFVAKDNAEYIPNRYAYLSLRNELKLFFVAFKSDADATQQLHDIISDAINKSPYTIDTDTQEAAQEVPRATSDIFQRLPLMHLKTYGIMNDNNARLMREPDILKLPINGQMTIHQYLVKEGKDVNGYMSLQYESDNVTLSKKITAFDMSVYNAISTRVYHEKKKNPGAPVYLTALEIWRTMTGRIINDHNVKPSKAQLQKIADSINKMRCMLLYVDMSEEWAKYDIKCDDSRIIGGKVNTYFLDCAAGGEFKLENGKIVYGFCFDKIPILYTINEARQRVLTVPYEMLDVSENTSITDYVIEFRDYLLQQVKLMKDSEEDKTRFTRNTRILLKTLYDQTDTDPEKRIKDRDYKDDKTRQAKLRTIRQDDRKKIEAILTTWKQKKWIKGYKQVVKSSAVIGYDIKL